MIIHTILIAGMNMLREKTTNVGNHLWPQIAHTRIQSNATASSEYCEVEVADTCLRMKAQSK